MFTVKAGATLIQWCFVARVVFSFMSVGCDIPLKDEAWELSAIVIFRQMFDCCAQSSFETIF